MLYCPVTWTKSVCFPSLYQWRLLLRAEIVSQGSHWYVCECVGLSERERRSGLDPGTGLSYCTDLELDLVPWPGAKSSGHWVTAAKTELRMKYENTEILSIFYNICQRLNISKSQRAHDFLSITEKLSETGQALYAEVLERLLEAWRIHLEKGELTEKGTDPAVLRSQSRLGFIPKKKLGILLTIICDCERLCKMWVCEW